MDQMHIGVYLGLCGDDRGPGRAAARPEIGRPVKVIATGGLAVLFDEHTGIFDAIDADLTIQGLGHAVVNAAQQRPMNNDVTPADELLFLALGGSGEIGMNVNLYGCRGQVADGRSAA